jgi:hypothetical protein
MPTSASFTFLVASLQRRLNGTERISSFNGWRIVQLFYPVNSGGFLLLPLEYGKRDITRYPVAPRELFPPPLDSRESKTFNLAFMKVNLPSADTLFLLRPNLTLF